MVMLKQVVQYLLNQSEARLLLVNGELQLSGLSQAEQKALLDVFNSSPEDDGKEPDPIWM